MKNTPHWQAQHHIETTAHTEAIWRLFADVGGWKRWNAGIEHVSLDGAFASGSTFEMQPPGQDAFTSRLVEVRENEGFVDETQVGDLVVRVSHTIETAGPHRRIVYAIEATGPEAEVIGPAIASDFPEVLAALARLAETTG